VPIYDYSCTACGHLTEVIHGIYDDGPRFCPACGSEGTMRKGFATPAVHFKGSGWARKDRSGASARSRASGDGGSDVGSDSGSDGASGAARTEGAGSSKGGAKDGGSSTASEGSSKSPVPGSTSGED
jgi:putative FmdB family regulatory protein